MCSAADGRHRKMGHTRLARDSPRCGSWPGLAHSSTVRASMGGPPREEGPALWGTPAQVIVATAGVSLRLSLAPWLLALQLLQFIVDRAQTPLTGDVLPPAHHEGAPRTMGPLLATGGVLQIGEPSMDGCRIADLHRLCQGLTGAVIPRGFSPSVATVRVRASRVRPSHRQAREPCCRGLYPGGALWRVRRESGARGYRLTPR